MFLIKKIKHFSKRLLKTIQNNSKNEKYVIIKININIIISYYIKNKYIITL